MGLALVVAVALSACAGGGGPKSSPTPAAVSPPATSQSVSPSAFPGVETIHVGPAPAHVAIGFGSVWVTLHHGSSVVRIDPVTRKLIATIPMGEQPIGLAAGAGSIWALTFADSSLNRIDPRTNEVTTVRVTRGVGEVCGFPLVTAHLILVRDCGLQVTVEVDPENMRVVGSLPASVQAQCGGIRGGAIVLAGNGQLVRLDSRSGRVLDRRTAADARCELGRGLRDGLVWVGSGEDPTVKAVSVISLDTGEVVRIVDVGNGPETFATGDAVWVRAVTWHQLQRIDPATFEVTATVPYPDDVTFGGFAVGFDAAWLTDFDHDRLIRVDLSA
jgi:YVTN family beta-propeller protein